MHVTSLKMGPEENVMSLRSEGFAAGHKGDRHWFQDWNPFTEINLKHFLVGGGLALRCSGTISVSYQR